MYFLGAACIWIARAYWGARRVHIHAEVHAAPSPAPTDSSDACISTALTTAVELQQPSYLSHRDASAAPVDRFAQRKALILGHRPQCLPSAPLSVPDEGIAFTKRGQHRDCQSFEPALPDGTFFAQGCLSV
jgi:hypothetical protein